MPLLKIETNAAVDAAAESAFVTAASAAVAQMLGKPERYVMVSMRRNTAMAFAGSQQPLAHAELKSLGLPEDRAKELSAGICDLLQQHLGVSPERIYVELSGPPRQLWGWNRGTF